VWLKGIPGGLVDCEGITSCVLVDSFLFEKYYRVGHSDKDVNSPVFVNRDDVLREIPDK
jgi:hypothetical protein